MKYVVLIFYISLGFDSLLKINLGFNLHISLVVAVILVLFYLLTNIEFLGQELKRDFRLYLFLFLCFFWGLVKSTAGVFDVSIYLVFIVITSLFVSITYSQWSTKVFLCFQWVLIITGIFQYLLYKISGYQVSFIDSEHYMKGYSVASRLRGFFIEPNWFSIAMAFNTILLFKGRLFGLAKEHAYLVMLTFIVMILNGSFATLGILILVLMFPLLRTNPVTGMMSLLGVAVLLGGILIFRNSLSHGDSNLFNYASRLIPFERVLGYQSEQGAASLLWGNGFGSWGVEAIYHRLSVLVYDMNPSVRDGSEVPVILFELGLVGLLLIIIDSIFLMYKAGIERYYLAGGVLLFLVCLAFYPVFKFLMYMPYYFYVRQSIIRRDAYIAIR